MADDSNRPVILLAFSNTRYEHPCYLRSLPEEERRLDAALDSPNPDRQFELVKLPFATPEQIFDTFQDRRYRDRIVAFHFAGHGDGYRLLLEGTGSESKVVYPGGFAAFLGKQPRLHLVFLNACSTRPHAQELLDNGIKVVVATSNAIVDEVATAFANRFYRAIAASATVNRAYHEAAAAIRSGGNDDPGEFVRPFDTPSKIMDVRDFVREVHMTEEGFPWHLYTRKGADAASDWSLAEAASDPYSGLPPLSQKYYEECLGDGPFRYLDWFGEDDAAVFFGRGDEIRRLYNRVINPGAVTDPPALWLDGGRQVLATSGRLGSPSPSKLRGHLRASGPE